MVKLTEKQQKIFEWLDNKLQLPVFADAYKGAVISLKKKSPGYVTFVSHTARDIMNFLAKTVAGIRGGRTQYEQLIDDLQEKWKDDWRGHGLTSSKHLGKGHVIPFQVCEMIYNLVKKHKEGRSRSRGADELFFNMFLGFSDKDKIPSLEKWEEVKDFFLKRAHLREKKFTLDDQSELEENFKWLENCLYIAATSEYSRTSTLNEILEETNK